MRRYLACMAAAVVVAACEEPLEVDPTASIDQGEAITSGKNINLAVNGAYRSLTGGSAYGRNQLVYPDLYADNLDFTGTFQTDREFALRNVTATNGDVSGMWTTAFGGVGRANQILSALPNISDMSDADKTRARGEALFVRALEYYILNSWFGGVPIVTSATTTAGEIAKLPRNTAAEVWAQVETDLEAALPLLPTGRVAGRATQGAANALLARVYLEDGKYALARDKATAVISNTLYRLNTSYKDNWLVENSAESIFELQYTINQSNSIAFWFYPSSLGGRRGFAPSASLNSAYPSGDTRKAANIAMDGTRRYGFKYTRIANGDDNVPVLRLAEMYLIRAEANARLGADPATVRADINVVRTRAGAPPIAETVTTQQALLDAILLERRLEFPMEGHRFFDLRRHGRAQTQLNLAAEKLLLPIPQRELDVNDLLVQNAGY